MSFWSKIGLASHKELVETKREMAESQDLLKKEIQLLFHKQTITQEEMVESLKETFLEATSQLEKKQKEDADALSAQVLGMKTRISKQLTDLTEQGQDLQTKIDMVQEIAKIQWASSLIDYVEELLDETEEKTKSARNEEDSSHPYHYDFGEVTTLFKFICRSMERAGFHIGWRNTKQTVQIYLRKEDGEKFENQIGAIQYEGSNDFDKKAPSTITLRFIIKNMPDMLVQELSSLLPKQQADLLLNRQKDIVSFRFYQLDAETKQKMNRISETISLSVVK
ncbi:hypothetical protein JCM9140_3932 [Halalkalibacter wakoensis JCM 9140]|uniref:Uncharacterized protein n=1 Tax=Halalkalibacter wakoensis JCM 9140 TaxID=1236970 RepID=W4Q7U0_9BACI|nr:hypothetical protein [Halalkalibacter wakoensis]GAE27773.1 hypothetical protein JCM9140_3932 [Halalkalibacter wakoensis JCM 9140]